ncbi:hypothetical protein KJB99_10175 [Staphylococcus epidermidis]|jgi:hypothetical protein|uniref:hypothetical protein n=1 Tax=Staphylococcus epidermidis TaxID=1282 RepID=UPI000D1C75E8|nr:hypothetical protein [Staphylococcus epidermidis]MCE5030057.1 hypothetical protein [Staphylococcus epidermidis]MCE5032363.1 hypothetical protein [Staphylococcus epidermidis]PTE46861.1 hypothetical protein BUY75_02660 [Staphylococcus epidermidis]
MSNTENNRIVTIGINESNKEFTIRESAIEPENFEKFLTNLGQAMDNTIERISIREKDGEFLYLNFDSVSYVHIFDELDK